VEDLRRRRRSHSGPELRPRTRQRGRRVVGEHPGRRIPRGPQRDPPRRREGHRLGRGDLLDRRPVRADPEAELAARPDHQQPRPLVAGRDVLPAQLRDLPQLPDAGLDADVDAARDPERRGVGGGGPGQQLAQGQQQPRAPPDADPGGRVLPQLPEVRGARVAGRVQAVRAAEGEGAGGRVDRPPLTGPAPRMRDPVLQLRVPGDVRPRAADLHLHLGAKRLMRESHPLLLPASTRSTSPPPRFRTLRRRDSVTKSSPARPEDRISMTVRWAAAARARALAMSHEPGAGVSTSDAIVELTADRWPSTPLIRPCAVYCPTSAITRDGDLMPSALRMLFDMVLAIRSMADSMNFSSFRRPLTMPWAAAMPALYMASPAVVPACPAAPTRSFCWALICLICALLALARAAAEEAPPVTPACAICAIRSERTPFFRSVARCFAKVCAAAVSCFSPARIVSAVWCHPPVSCLVMSASLRTPFFTSSASLVRA